MQNNFYIKDKDEIAKVIENLLKCFHADEENLAGCARYQLDKQRCYYQKAYTVTIGTRSNFTARLRRMEELNDLFHFWTPHSFVEMRNIACTRITLVNGRRRGEVARLLVENWNDAESNAWIDDQRIQNLDEADKALIKALKITYMTGKGKHHTVPLYFLLTLCQVFRNWLIQKYALSLMC